MNHDMHIQAPSATPRKPWPREAAIRWLQDQQRYCNEKMRFGEADAFGEVIASLSERAAPRDDVLEHTMQQMLDWIVALRRDGSLPKETLDTAENAARRALKNAAPQAETPRASNGQVGSLIAPSLPPAESASLKSTSTGFHKGDTSHPPIFEASRCVAVPKEKLEHWLEYWNGNTNQSAMHDALQHILGEIETVLHGERPRQS